MIARKVLSYCEKIFLLVFIVIIAVSLPLAASADIGVEIDGKEHLFDPHPIIQEGRTLVPMRALFEALGATVDWEAAPAFLHLSGNEYSVYYWDEKDTPSVVKSFVLQVDFN